MEFKEANLATQVLQAIKADWDSQRVPGKPHPLGAAFKVLAWRGLWETAEALVHSAEGSMAGLVPADKEFVLKCVRLLLDRTEDVDNLYRVLLERKKKSSCRVNSHARDSRSEKDMPASEVAIPCKVSW